MKAVELPPLGVKALVYSASAVSSAVFFAALSASAAPFQAV